MKRDWHPLTSAGYAFVFVVVLLGSAVFAVPIKAPKEQAKPNAFSVRSGPAREKLLRDGGGTAKSEVAVALGLKWIVNHQKRDGSWSLDGYPCKCGGWGTTRNDIAATAFGLLPLLGAGHTHKMEKHKKNTYRRNVLLGLNYLMRNKTVGPALSSLG
jgi:hypothetical protein